MSHTKEKHDQYYEMAHATIMHYYTKACGANHCQYADQLYLQHG